MRLSEPEGDALPQIKGYAALFDDPYDVGWFKERIQRGAFKESLENGDDIRALFNHDPNLILGRASAGTLRLGEDKKGLWYSIDAPDTQLGRDLVESLRRGDITQSSFAFETIEDQWHTNDGEEERILIRAKLWDVSPTTFGANANTTSEAATRSHDLWVASKPTADHGDIEERQAMLRELSGGKPE
jgi:hypothetical protein